MPSQQKEGKPNVVANRYRIGPLVRYIISQKLYPPYYPASNVPEFQQTAKAI